MFLLLFTIKRLRCASVLYVYYLIWFVFFFLFFFFHGVWIILYSSRQVKEAEEESRVGLLIVQKTASPLPWPFQHTHTGCDIILISYERHVVPSFHMQILAAGSRYTPIWNVEKYCCSSIEPYLFQAFLIEKKSKTAKGGITDGFFSFNFPDNFRVISFFFLSSLSPATHIREHCFFSGPVRRFVTRALSVSKKFTWSFRERLPFFIIIILFLGFPLHYLWPYLAAFALFLGRPFPPPSFFYLFISF